MSSAWFCIIHGTNRTRYAHLFATSVGHPNMGGTTTACSVDAYAQFPKQSISFQVAPDAEHCPQCEAKEREWTSSGTDQGR